MFEVYKAKKITQLYYFKKSKAALKIHIERITFKRFFKGHGNSYNEKRAGSLRKLCPK
jgi:hypothetical protein